MKLRSFRTRIALVSAVLAGSALVGFGGISWWLIYNAKLSRLDAALKIQLIRAGRPRQENRWQFYEALLPRALETHAQTPIALLVISTDSKTIYRSEQWPTDLEVNSLWFSRTQASLYPLPPNKQRRSLSSEINQDRPERLEVGSDQENLGDNPPDKSGEIKESNNLNPKSSSATQKPKLNDRLPNIPQLDFRLVTEHASKETWRVGAATFPRNRRGGGAGSREQGEQSLPRSCEAERNMGTSPALPGRLTGAEYKLRLSPSPLLPAPCSPASFDRVAIAVSLQSIDREMLAIGNVFLISIPVLLLLIAGGAWWLSGTALRPIGRLTTAIRQVTVKGLEQRVAIGATDVEFVELIEVFNQMLERLERSFKQASRFSGDAAHELKTPLTILQGELEHTLQQAEPGSEVQQSLGSLLDEVHRLSAIVRKLLLLSLADAGQMSLYLVEVNLSGLLIEMMEDIELLAPHLEVQTEFTTELRVQGDRDLLVQVLQNLISNAIKYNLPAGWIRIQAHRQGTTVSVTITNSSKDIPANERERIFDRFHRGSPTLTRKVEGTGLGLSLAWEIARAHRGDLALDPTPSGQTAFTLTLLSTT